MKNNDKVEELIREEIDKERKILHEKCDELIADIEKLFKEYNVPHVDVESERRELFKKYKALLIKEED